MFEIGQDDAKDCEMVIQSVGYHFLKEFVKNKMNMLDGMLDEIENEVELYKIIGARKELRVILSSFETTIIEKLKEQE